MRRLRTCVSVPEVVRSCVTGFEREEISRGIAADRMGRARSTQRTALPKTHSLDGRKQVGVDLFAQQRDLTELAARPSVFQPQSTIV